MKIITKSIRDNLEIQLNKPIEEITQEDLSKIKSITIDKIDYSNKIKNINYDEILCFNNLEELNVFNCMINKKIMDNILKINNLKKLNIYNCDFVDYIDDWFSKMKIEELTISNCLGINGISLNNLKYLKLRNINVDFLIENIEILDISNTKVNIEDLNFYNVKKIIISDNNYNENTHFASLETNIIIVDDKMNIIKEIKNA